MIEQAFSLNIEFISELHARICSAGDASKPVADLVSEIPPGKVPAPEHLAQLLEAVFWSSYEKEEGKTLTVSVIYREPEHTTNNFCFDQPLSLNPRSLIKLAPAVENPRAHISVWADGDGTLRIWGFRSGPDDFIIADLWIQCLGPGSVLVTYGGRSLAALSGSQAVFIDAGILMKAILPRLSPSPKQDNPYSATMMRYNSLLFLARAMRAHGHGGTILVVPEDSDWHRSIVHPIPYKGGASFLDSDFENLQSPVAKITSRKSFVEFIKKAFTRGQDRLANAREIIRGQCNRIARLTAVDGALVISPDRYTYCFGAKIQPVDPNFSTMTLQEITPVEGGTRSLIGISDLGGTRHQSAAQFAWDQPQAIAISASQDGEVTFFIREEGDRGGVLAVRKAELALLHEGLSGALWNISLFSDLEQEK